jgi:hypothetical protein
MGKEPVKSESEKDVKSQVTDAAMEHGETSATAQEVKPRGVDIAAGHLEDMLSHRTHNTALPAYRKEEIEKFIKKSFPGLSVHFDIKPVEQEVAEGEKPVFKNGMHIILKEFADEAIVPKSGPYMFGDF